MHPVQNVSTIRSFRILVLLGLSLGSFLVIRDGRYPWNAPSTYASGDILINWGVASGSPLFSFSNTKPGDSVTHSVTLTNSSPVTRYVGIRTNHTGPETDALAPAYRMSVLKGSTILYGPKPLTETFIESSRSIGVPLLPLIANQTETITLVLAFDPNAGNDFQGTSVRFDIVLGTTLPIPPECTMPFTGQVLLGTYRKDTLIGTKGNDILVGFEENDVLRGNDGDDCIVGLDGNETLDGQAGNDVLAGGIGHDNLVGGGGNDVLMGEEGNDTLVGSNDDDVMKGGPGTDSLDGGPGNDRAEGGEGNDTLVGQSGNDTLRGDAGVDTASGGTGTDTCVAETRRNCEW